LSTWSSEWRQKYGSKLTIDWSFTQNKSIPENNDMITAVAFAPGAIGYVGISKVDLNTVEKERGIRFAKMQNKYGNVTLPLPENVKGTVIHRNFHFRIDA